MLLHASQSTWVAKYPLTALIHTHTHTHARTHTHTHTFNGPFFGTTQVSRYQKGKTNLDFTEARDSEWQWQWHQLGHMQVCTLLQIDNHASTPPLECPSCRLTYSVKALKADTCSISITPAHCSAPALRPPAHRIFGAFRSDFYSTQWWQQGWQERCSVQESRLWG